MLFDASNNQSGGDAFKKFLAEQAKREALRRSQDYLNNKFADNDPNLDFTNYPDDSSLKDIFKDNAKKVAKNELKRQGAKLFDRAKENNPRLGQAQEAFYDPENDDPEKRFADIKGTNKGKIRKLTEELLKEEGKKRLKEKIKKALEEYLEKAGERTATEEARHLVNTGFKKGVGWGARKVLKPVVKEGVEGIAKAGTKAVIEGGAKLGTDAVVDVGLEATAETLGAVGALETFGISEILAQLIVIAISLGISDAIDGTECLLKKEYEKAIHFFVRAATKIIVFVLFIVIALISVAILPVIGIIIPLVLINLYWSLSIIPFVQDMAIAQGLVWWEKIIIVVMDLAAIFTIAMTVIIALYIYCNVGSLSGAAVGTTVAGPIGGAVGGAVGSVVDSLTTSNGSFCSAFQGGTTSGAGGGGGSVGSASGDETVGAYTPPGGACKYANVNLCKGVVTGNCADASVVSLVQTKWGPVVKDMVQKYGPIPGVSNTESFIKAIMIHESAGKPDAQSSTGCSGLMQFCAAAASENAPLCGGPAHPSGDWLKANPEISICMSIKMFQSIAKGACGQPRVEVRNLAAGYNRGPGYCQPADGKFTKCSGNGCDATPIKSWECVYDKNGTSCNKYVEEGQKYAPQVFGCYVKLNGNP